MAFSLQAIAPRLRLLLCALWVGNLLTIGYLVAPTLFATLADRALAGTIAGSLFQVQFFCSLVLGSLLLALLLAGREPGLWGWRGLGSLILLMLALSLLNQFALRPQMALVREAMHAGGMVVDAGLRSRFGILHGISSVLYMIQSLCGLVLLWRMR